MPLQNRVDPRGNIVATSALGTFMGNRGILHNPNKQLVKTYQHRNWIICVLQHKNVRRKVMSPNTWTELFFLDEATAFAAGHRPCCECRRARYYEFKNLWVKTNLGVEPKSLKAADMDKIIHKERVERKMKVTYKARLKYLPDGVFFQYDDVAYLSYENMLYCWTFEGYLPEKNVEFPEEVDVLTPKSIVKTFIAGFKPLIHESIQRN